MPESFYDTIVILFFTVVPIILLLIQVLLSTRRKPVWGLVVPLLWTLLGTWVILSGYFQGRGFSGELFIVFFLGDLILTGVMVLMRYIKKKRK